MKFHIVILSLSLLISSAACGQTNANADKSSVETNATQQATVQVVSVAEFKEKSKLPGAQIIDVRTDGEVAEGMIENAVQMNVAKWKNFVTAAEGLDPSKPVLVYCKSGGRSNSAATYLVEQGFTQVYDLDGGITSWNQCKEPTVKP